MLPAPPEDPPLEPPDEPPEEPPDIPPDDPPDVPPDEPPDMPPDDPPEEPPEESPEDPPEEPPPGMLIPPPPDMPPLLPEPLISIEEQPLSSTALAAMATQARGMETCSVLDEMLLMVSASLNTGQFLSAQRAAMIMFEVLQAVMFRVKTIIRGQRPINTQAIDYLIRQVAPACGTG